MAMTLDYIKPRVKMLLSIDDTQAYDDLLDILILAAQSKMEIEGVPNVFEDGSSLGMQYILCLSYEVSTGLNMEADQSVVLRQYITGVNELRCLLKVKQD